MSRRVRRMLYATLLYRWAVPPRGRIAHRFRYFEGAVWATSVCNKKQVRAHNLREPEPDGNRACKNCCARTAAANLPDWKGAE